MVRCGDDFICPNHQQIVCSLVLVLLQLLPAKAMNESFAVHRSRMRATRYSAVQTNKQSAVQSRSLLLLHDKNCYVGVCTKSEKYVHSCVEEKEQLCSAENG